jgi:hypothetical protein
MGPAVSKLSASGMTPARLINPSVGLSPTTLLAKLGEMMLPEVSVPTAAVVSAIDSATPDPDEEPLGVDVNR